MLANRQIEDQAALGGQLSTESLSAVADNLDNERVTRRRVLVTAGLAVATASWASGAPAAESRTDTAPRTLDGEPVPEPSPEQSAGPVKAGRGSTLSGKTAVVTGAARGIGRAIAVEFAANGADVVAIDIAGPVSPGAPDAVPATLADLEETVRQIKAFGRRAEGIKADIRDIAAPRSAADHIVSVYGKIDIVVADAAIQRWKPLLEMDDAEWRDVIDNNLGDPRPDEVSGTGAGAVPHHCQRADSRSRRYPTDALYKTINGEHGRNGTKAARKADAPAGLGCSGTYRTAQSWLVAAG
jgi:NAD(P)-dependent dehydrogenase (short-subunit alcohol dehydrogenase family)